MQFLDVPVGFTRGNTAIVVPNNELNNFEEFIKFHHVNHGYANFKAILKRVRNSGLTATFYFDWGRMHYYLPGCSPRWMVQVQMTELYSENDMTDILSLLEHAS